MAEKYLYVCPDCLEFYHQRLVNTCIDCGNTLTKTDIPDENFDQIPADRKKRIKDEYIKAHGLVKKEKPEKIDPPEVKSGFSIGFLKVIAYLSLIVSLIGGVITMNLLLIVSGLLAFAIMHVTAEMAMNIKCIRAMVEDRFYGKNRL